MTPATANILIAFILGSLGAIAMWMFLVPPDHAIRIHWAAALIANTFGWGALRLLMSFFGFVFGAAIGLNAIREPAAPGEA